MSHGAPAWPEAVRLELFTNRFRAIALEMGAMLERTAVSTNVKERLDFSCAILDPDGELVVNAPHIPVHLGALGLCVRTVRRHLELAPGDTVVTNHPAFGGSHLPDVTLITPVFERTRGQTEPKLLGYVANRAHHAELGGERPGSMPPNATTLAQEGVVLPPTYLFRRGSTFWKDIESLLRGGRWPSRAPEENLADLRASVAANHRGAEALRLLVEAHGRETALHYMEGLKKRAEHRMREALARLPDGTREAAEELDDGAPIRVRVAVLGDQVDIDFAGTAGIHPGNLNATPAVVHSAVIYVMRLLVKEALPLNEGLMRPVQLRLPPDSLLDPAFRTADGELLPPESSPAVVGGNVETSQRIVDTLLKALTLAACSQGTMNNVLFGASRFGYYETVGGGGGAGPGFEGADGVHTHMTNTRITDPELLERRYPVRLERFALRRGSGGAGRWKGGDGLVRELRFLQEMELSVLSQHRRSGPYGLDGGEPGLAGTQQIARADGNTETLPAIGGTTVKPGDRFILETPGGGGFGPSEKLPPTG